MAEYPTIADIRRIMLDRSTTCCWRAVCLEERMRPRVFCASCEKYMRERGEDE
jgi:hypothetical protein